MAYGPRVIMKAARLARIVGVFSMALGCDAAANTLEGDWVGGFEEGTDWTYVQMHFEKERDSFKGTFDVFLLPFDFVQGRRIDGTVVDSSHVRFQSRAKSQTFSFDGQIRNGTMTGTVARADKKPPFRVDRIAKVNAASYAGVYRFGSDHVLSIGPSALLGSNFIGFIDFKTGRIGGLYPRSETDFFSGPSMLVTYPAEARVRFTEKSETQWNGLEWTDTGGAQRKAERIVFRKQDIAFANADVALAGTLIRPATGSNHPAIIFVPASTAMATREMARPVAEFFAAYGVACLIYDKRGTGSSTGDWLRAGFDDLANDALAAVTALASRDDIDPARIGLWGGSQSGWIVALAASQATNVAFIISQSGPGVTPEEQELYRSESWMRADGYSRADIDQAMAIVRQRYAWSRTGEGLEALEAAERTARKQPWYPYIGAFGGKENPFWHFWKLIRDYDPVPALEKVRCPVLATFGGRDTFVPVAKSVANWEAGLKKAGNKDVTIKVFPAGDHSLVEAKTGGLKEIPHIRRFVPGYWELQRDWVLQRVSRRE